MGKETLFVWMSNARAQVSWAVFTSKTTGEYFKPHAHWFPVEEIWLQYFWQFSKTINIYFWPKYFYFNFAHENIINQIICLWIGYCMTALHGLNTSKKIRSKRKKQWTTLLSSIEIVNIVYFVCFSIFCLLIHFSYGFV